MSKTKLPEVVAMVHVHSNNALQNTVYNDLMDIKTYSVSDFKTIERLRKEFAKSLDSITADTGLELLRQCRTAPLILDSTFAEYVKEEFGQTPFVKQFINRALAEVAIFVQNGINHVSVENVGAPYFIGNEVPVEDMAILYLVANAIRKEHPKLNMGIHVLSSDELESLPIAISCDAMFIRSESSVFSGFRPEGKTINRGNLAKFYYLRNYFRTKLGANTLDKSRTPALWADLQKKHTVFEKEITDLNVWLDNILFQKIEGIILTGQETGSDIADGELKQARMAVDMVKAQTKKYFGEAVDIPIITGSGLDVENYNRYADYIIVGSTLKKNGYWENEVTDEKVKELLAKIKG